MSGARKSTTLLPRVVSLVPEHGGPVVSLHDLDDLGVVLAVRTRVCIAGTLFGPVRLVVISQLAHSFQVPRARQRATTAYPCLRSEVTASSTVSCGPLR